MAVSRRLRYEVMRRDGFICRYCHRSDLPLTIDHVVPVALGGRDVPENLVTACHDCNAGKTSSSPDAPLVVGVSDDAIRWSAAMQKAAEIQRKNCGARDEYIARFSDAWPSMFALPRDWRSGIGRWFDMGVELELLLDCVDAACDAYGVDWRWKYFCGCVWRRIGERQDIAREIIARQEEEA